MPDSQAVSSDPQDIRAYLAVGMAIGYFAAFFVLIYLLWNTKIDVDSLMIIFGSITSSTTIGITWYFASKTQESS